MLTDTAALRHYTVGVLVANEPGVLFRVSGLFSRRGFNIESLAVGPTQDHTVSRITLVVSGDDQHIEQLVQQPFGSLGLALSTYAGQNYGARKLARIRQGLRESLLAVLVFSAFMLLVMQLFSYPIIRIFINEPSVIELGAKALRLTSWFYFFLGLIYTTRGVQNGIGDSLFALTNGVVEMICRIGLPMILIHIPGLGVWGIWWCAGLSWMISSFFCVLRYRSWNRKSALNAPVRQAAAS